MIEIREAVPSDSNELQSLQEKCPMGSDLKVSLKNLPDFFSIYQNYPVHKVFVATDKKRIIGAISAAVMPSFVQGNLVKVGYLSKIFVEEESRKTGGAIILMKAAEKWVMTQAVALIYCIVMEGNPTARKFVNALGYRPTITLTLRYLPIFKAYSKSLPNNLSFSILTENDYPAAVNFFNEFYQKTDFFAPLDNHNFKALLNGPGFSEKYCFLMKDKRQETILAAAVIWDWSQVCDTRIFAMDRELRYIKWVSDRIRRIVPFPRVPDTGQRVKQWCIHFFAGVNSTTQSLMLKQIQNEAFKHNIDYLCIIGHGSSEIFKVSRSFFCSDGSEIMHMKLLDNDIHLSGPVFIPAIDL